MEVKIGVQHVTRELVLESKQTPAEISAAVAAAFAGKVPVLTLADEKGRIVHVPSDKLAYVEIGEPSSRKVGFGVAD